MPASITLTVAHLPTSTSFFLSALQPLNYVYRGRVNDTIGFGNPDSAPDFWITQSILGVPPGPAHVAFPALSRAQVHEFFHAALKAGGRVHGEPSLRDDCGYYSAAIIDVDGNSIEAVFRPDLLEANKENAGGAKSVVSMTKSVAKSKAPTVVSSASKAKSVAPSKAGSVAPSAAKSSLSKAPSATSSRPSSAAPSRASSNAPSATRSAAPTAVAASEASARTTISRASTAPAAPQGTGTNFMDMLNEAKGTVAFAREMVNQARPLMNAPASTAANGSPDSHASSDAIVGTLLGVAAGAALHYAFSNRSKPNETASAPITPPEGYRVIARSESSPSWTEERMYYYHSQPQRALPASSQASATPYAIEAPPSEVSRVSASRLGGQRLIEMVDNNLTVSEVAGSTVRPRRRSSFSGVSAARTSSSRAKSGVKMLEGPPTSYRGPTVVTMASNAKTHASHRSRSTSRPADEGYASATDDRKTKVSSAHTHGSRRASSLSRHSSRRDSAGSSTTTTITAIKTPSQTPLPASRAASHIDDHDRDSFYSSRSKANKTVIGRLTEKQLHKLEEGGRVEKGRTDVTKSVISKIKDVDRMDLTRKELRPEDSVSQVSSSRGSRRHH